MRRDTGWATDGHEVWSLNDMREHMMMECWCDPYFDEYGILIHNSLDRREYYEVNRSKFS